MVFKLFLIWKMGFILWYQQLSFFFRTAGSKFMVYFWKWGEAEHARLHAWQDLQVKRLWWGAGWVASTESLQFLTFGVGRGLVLQLKVGSFGANRIVFRLIHHFKCQVFDLFIFQFVEDSNFGGFYCAVLGWWWWIEAGPFCVWVVRSTI